MNKVLILTVLVALLALNTEGYRVARQAEEDGGVVEAVEAVEAVEEPVVEAVEEPVVEAVEEPVMEAVQEAVPYVEPAAPAEEEGTMTRFTGTVKSYYDGAVNTATGYLDSIKGLKLEEKAQNMYHETTNVVGTYAGILNDQLYHMLNPQH